VIADRDMHDAEVRGVSVPGRFNSAYSAVRTLATIVIRASGYRVKGGDGGHRLTFDVLALLDSAFDQRASYFNRCRKKRNDITYTGTGYVANTETEELLRIAHAFAGEVAKWLKTKRQNGSR